MTKEALKKKVVHSELTYRDLTKELQDKLNKVTACYTLLATLEDATGSGLSEDEENLMAKLKREIDELMKDNEIRKEMQRITEEKIAYTGSILWKPDRLF